MWRAVILFLLAAGVVALAIVLGMHMSQGAMDVIAGLVAGIGATVLVSLVVIAAVGDRMGHVNESGAIDVYRAGLIDGARMAERLAAGGTVTTITQRHRMELMEEMRR